MRIALIQWSTDRNHRDERVDWCRDVVSAGRWLDENPGLICGDEANAQAQNYFHRWLREAYQMPKGWRRPAPSTLRRSGLTLADHVRRVGVRVRLEASHAQ